MSTAAARREARMKKITEQGGSRLQKIISYEKVQEEIDRKNTACEPIPDINSFNTQINQIIQEPTINELSTSLTSIFQNGNFTGASSPSIGSTNPEIHNKNIRIVVITASAIFTTILQLISLKLSDSYDLPYANQIFTPFLLYEFINLFILKRNPEVNNLSSVLVLFANIPPHVSRRIVTVVSTITMFIQDLMIYFFVYIFVNLFIDIMC